MEKVKRKIIKIDEKLCNGCGNCVPSCPEQALLIVDTLEGKKARLVKDFYCDGLGACLGSCPTGALTVEEKEADAYNEEATVARIIEVAPQMLDEHLKHLKEHSRELPQNHFNHSCPGSNVMFWDGKEKETANGEQKSKNRSELRHWPVQLALVNPSAPYFENADLLIAADCVPFAYPDFHSDFLKGKSLVIGCPKLDDASSYREKLAAIFRQSDIKSVTVVNMEVPCCFGLRQIVKEALNASGKKIPYREIVVGIKGGVK